MKAFYKIGGRGIRRSKEAYHKIFKAVYGKDYAIRRRYDGLTGGRYLVIVSNIFMDVYIDEKDLESFRPEIKEIIKNF
ncbi:hypothetical protein [Ferruginibacter sp.]|uniref:hypothetical protein n=1 Tax=Ferruginibacter sp. TaxID=1940288 RepID=UPI00265A0695|nr:hypothetical protein [Ferruginibacter sp.]